MSNEENPVVEPNDNVNTDTVVADPAPPEVPDELVLLKERADTMGIKYHPSIGIDKLKEKIEETRNNLQLTDTEKVDEVINNIDINAVSVGAPVVETGGQRRVRLRKEATKLVRIRVTNMNPIKSNLKGEILCAGNASIGMVKKFIPFNAEQGWHVPQILLTQLQNRKYMSHYEVKIGNQRIKKHKLIPEFAIEILKPLTPKEIKELAQRQIIADK